ncbi:MAG: hypothetical protein RR232_07845 [Clostridia bacterium]
MHFTNDLTLSNFEQMSALERRYYGDDHITPAAQAYAWYLQYPYTVTAMLDSGRVAGFANLFPISDRVFQSLQAGSFNDKYLTLDDIVDISIGGLAPLHMFLCCIVLDAAYRADCMSFKLLLAAMQPYEALLPRCDILITDNVTQHGEHFSQRLGLCKLCDTAFGSKIYQAEYSIFRNAVLLGSKPRN